MTREEAIKWLGETIQDTDTYWESCSAALQKELDEQKEVFLLAISALRPVSRELVEKAWMGCKYCDEEWGTCDPITNRFAMPPRGGIRFCPMCGRPLTDEAVEMVMERINKMEGMENESC